MHAGIGGGSHDLSRRCRTSTQSQDRLAERWQGGGRPASSLTPKKSLSCMATTATTNQLKAFCHGRLIVQSITSATVMRPPAPLPPAHAAW